MEQRINNMEAKLRKNEYNKLIDDQMKNYVDKKIESMMIKMEEFEKRTEISKQSKELNEDIKLFDPKKKPENSIEIEKIETAVNEWVKKIEKQLNVIKDL